MERKMTQTNLWWFGHVKEKTKSLQYVKLINWKIVWLKKKEDWLKEKREPNRERSSK